MSRNAYEKKIVEMDRENAREKFQEWCEMQADVHEEVEFVGRQNDVARLHIKTNGNHRARDLMSNYSIRGRTPIRVYELNAVDEETVEIGFLLAELRPPE